MRTQRRNGYNHNAFNRRNFKEDDHIDHREEDWHWYIEFNLFVDEEDNAKERSLAVAIAGEEVGGASRVAIAV